MDGMKLCMLLFMSGLAEYDENFLVPNKNDTTFLVKVKKKKPKGGWAGSRKQKVPPGGAVWKLRRTTLFSTSLYKKQDVDKIVY